MEGNEVRGKVPKKVYFEPNKDSLYLFFDNIFEAPFINQVIERSTSYEAYGGILNGQFI